MNNHNPISDNTMRINDITIFGLVLLFGMLLGTMSVQAENETMVPIGAIKFACYEEIDISKKEFKLSEVGRDCVKDKWLEEHSSKKVSQNNETQESTQNHGKTEADQKSSENGIDVEKDKLSQSIDNLVEQLLDIATGESKLKSATSELLAEGGKIKAISNDRKDIYINIGENIGVRSGMRFEVVRQGEPIKSSGEVIGYTEEKIGKIEIIRTRKQISIGEIISKKEGKNAAKGDVVYPIKREIKSVATLLFPHNGTVDQLSQLVNEESNMSLVENGVEIRIIENPQNIAKEKEKNDVNFSTSQPVSVTSAVELGKMIDVQTVLTGKIAENAEGLIVTAKLIDVDSSSILASEKIEIVEATEQEVSTGEEQGSRKENLEVIYRQDFNHLNNGVHSISINRRNSLKANEIAEIGSLNNFILEVDAKEVQGRPAGYGVIFRKSGKSKFYIFVVSSTGMYRFSKQTSERWKWENIIDWTQSPFVNKNNKWDHIKVNANGQDIKLYANGNLLISIDDASLKKGKVALIATTGKTSSYINVQFDDLVVYKKR